MIVLTRKDKVTELVAGRVTKETKDRFDAVCAQEGVTASSVIAALIQEFLKGYPQDTQVSKV